jgi:hypothetical protein
VSRPKLLLFDTGCILEVLRQGLWQHLCSQYRVVVPSIIVRTEARYFNREPGNITPIDLGAEVTAGTIEEYEADLPAMQETLTRWPVAIRDRADAGELEALTYLRVTASEHVPFLTADGPAIQAAVALECGESAMSLDHLLNISGCARAGLERRFRDEFVEEHKRRGLQFLLGSLSPNPVPPGRRRNR